MRGERIEAVKNSLDVMVEQMRNDPWAVELVSISLIRFDRIAEVLVPLTELELFQIPEIDIPQSSPPHTGEALEFLCEQVEKDIIRDKEGQKGGWKPVLFIFTRGVPADKEKFKAVVDRVKGMNFGRITAFTDSVEDMELLADCVFELDIADELTYRLPISLNWNFLLDPFDTFDIHDLITSSNEYKELPPLPFIEIWNTEDNLSTSSNEELPPPPFDVLII